MERAVEYGNRNGSKDLVPPLPVAKLHEVVGPHQPDETQPREAPSQGSQGIGSVGRSNEPGFEIADDNASLSGGDPPSLFQAFGEGRHAGDWFQRVVRRDQPPHLVEIEAFESEPAEMQVAAMGRVERPAQEPDA